MGKRVLIVEDEALIAMELGERLSEFGYEVVGPAMTLEEAEALAGRESFDAALLDANLAGKSSVEFGEALVAKGVRIAFCTGYDRIKDLPAALANTPILTKPIGDADLRAALTQMFG